MEQKLKVVLIVVAIAVLIFGAFLHNNNPNNDIDINYAGDRGAGNEGPSSDRGFVSNILSGLDFTGSNIVADSIGKYSDVGVFEKLKINPFGD